MSNSTVMSLRVGVTGPMGEIGISTIAALEDHPAVTKVVGIARWPFDPSGLGCSKTTYRQGHNVDRNAASTDG